MTLDTVAPVRAVSIADAGPSPLARRALVNWCRRHARGGDAAVAASRRGGLAPLSPAQESDLVGALRDAHPERHGLPGRLWTAHTFGHLIHQRYGVRLTPRGVDRQLHAWGLAPRTPAERACALCVAAVVSWLSRDYPGITRRARGGGAQVCWAGRTRLTGVMPGAEVLAAVTTRGGLRFTVTTGRGDAPLPTEFLSRLAAHEGRGLHVILDGSFSPEDWPRRLPARVVLHPMPSCAWGVP